MKLGGPPKRWGRGGGGNPSLTTITSSCCTLKKRLSKPADVHKEVGSEGIWKVYSDGECREDLGFHCPIIKPFTVRPIYFVSLGIWTKHQHLLNTYLDIIYIHRGSRS